MGRRFRRGKVADQASETPSETEGEDVDWEPETVEVLDDPVRMYLREIGRVRLLTSSDERVLARKIEGGKHLQALRKEFEEAVGRPPRSWEASRTLLLRMVAAAPLVAALCKDLGLPGDLKLSQITGNPTLRDAIDAEVSQELLAAVAEDLGQEPEDVYAQVVNLSLSSWLLPPDAVDVLKTARWTRWRTLWPNRTAPRNCSAWSPCSGGISGASMQTPPAPRPI